MPGEKSSLMYPLASSGGIPLACCMLTKCYTSLSFVSQCDAVGECVDWRPQRLDVIILYAHFSFLGVRTMSILDNSEFYDLVDELNEHIGSDYTSFLVKHRMIGIASLQRWLNISRTTIYRFIRSGLPAYKIGSHYRFFPLEVISWFRENLMYPHHKKIKIND